MDDKRKKLRVFNLCVLLLIIVHTQALNNAQLYRKMRPGYIAEGSIVQEKTIASPLECGRICSREPHCIFYQYGKGKKTSCVALGEDLSQPHSLYSSQNVPVYKKDYCAEKDCKNGGTCVDSTYSSTCQCAPGFTGENCETNIDECSSSPCQNGGSCVDGDSSFTCSCPCATSGQLCQQVILHDGVAPSNWPLGDTPVYYNGFETTTDFTLKNGASMVNGHVGSCATQTIASSRQWLDFGTSASGACLVMGNCTDGGSMSVWMRIPACSRYDGFLSSYEDGKTGIVITCDSGIRSVIVLTHGTFDLLLTHPAGWFHMVSVLTAGIPGWKSYINGNLSGTVFSMTANAVQPGEGRLIIGRCYVGKNRDYGSVEVEELAFWNQRLNSPEVIDLYNQYQ